MGKFTKSLATLRESAQAREIDRKFRRDLERYRHCPFQVGAFRRTDIPVCHLRYRQSPVTQDRQQYLSYSQVTGSQHISSEKGNR